VADEKIVNQSKAEDQEIIEKERRFGKNQGIANKALREPVPTYEKVGSEKIEKGHNNTFIIQGRDRPSVAQSGYGGKGATRAGRIDLIAGLASSYRHSDGTYGPPNKKTIVNPNFAQDAARIYISQMTDIDHNMGLAPIQSPEDDARSAIGMKADQIRIHSRQDIRLVTGQSKMEVPGGEGERLSNGGINQTIGKICFIAGNNTNDEEYDYFNILEPKPGLKATKRKLQPVVKGDNLVMCLNELVDAVVYLTACVQSNNRILRSLNNAFIGHVHGVAGVATVPVHSGLPSSVVVGTLLATQAAALNNYSKGLGMLKNTFLGADDQLVKGPLYINSSFVYTT